MDKCVNCHHFDRGASRASDAETRAWGQCRRSAPQLHPINAKSYMVEGVWPHVRDDDWCGEWRASPRRGETRPHDLRPVDLLTPVPSTPMRTPPTTSLSSLQAAAAALGIGSEMRRAVNQDD